MDVGFSLVTCSALVTLGLGSGPGHGLSLGGLADPLRSALPGGLRTRMFGAVTGAWGSVWGRRAVLVDPPLSGPLALDEAGVLASSGLG